MRITFKMASIFKIDWVIYERKFSTSKMAMPLQAQRGRKIRQIIGIVLPTRRQTLERGHVFFLPNNMAAKVSKCTSASIPKTAGMFQRNLAAILCTCALNNHRYIRSRSKRSKRHVYAHFSRWRRNFRSIRETAAHDTRTRRIFRRPCLIFRIKGAFSHRSWPWQLFNTSMHRLR